MVAIHQPNFFPHVPFFEKMRECDLFILMSCCQYEKNGYQNRFEYNGWNTMAVNSGLEPIRVKRYLDPQDSWAKITRKLPSLKEFDQDICESLYITNERIIRRIAKKLGIKTEIGADFPTEKRGTERLIELCQHYGQKTYYSGSSGKNYLEMDKFNDAGIVVVFQESISKPIIPCLNT